MVRLSPKFVIVSAGACATALAAVGCQTAAPVNAAAAPTAAVSTSTAIRSDVTDIRPLAAAPAPSVGLAQTAAFQVAAEDAAPQPVTYTTLRPTAVSFAAPSTFASAAAPAAGAGNTHLVRHGETLYSIARESYGSGKAWKKIAMANPGVTPSTLKVGQSLIIP